LVFDVGRLAEALVLVLPLWPPSLLLLGVDKGALARRSGGTHVLVFDLVEAAKALAQFEHSSEMLALILAASQEATEQFRRAMEVEEAFLGRWSGLRLDFLAFAFGYAGAAALPLNMVEPGCSRWCLRLWGDVTSLCTIPSCNL